MEINAPHDNHDSAGVPDLERHHADALSRPQRRKRTVEASGIGRVAITIVSKRRRLLDPDNVCVKFAIDGLRYAGIIPNDDQRYVASLTVRQERSKRPETIVIVEEVEAPSVQNPDAPA